MGCYISLMYLLADGRRVISTEEYMVGVDFKGFPLQFQPWAGGDLQGF